MEQILTLQEEFENILQWTIVLSRFDIIKAGDNVAKKIEKIIRLYLQKIDENNGEISVKTSQLDKDYRNKGYYSNEHQTWVKLSNVLGYTFAYYVLYYDRKKQSSTIDEKLNSQDSIIVDEITNLIDDEYDYLKDRYDSFKEEAAIHEEKINNYIHQIATNVNIEDINILEQVVNKYYENPWIKKLTTYCRENKIDNENVRWLENIYCNYTLGLINTDIVKNRPSGCLLFFVKNDKPEFGEETKRFISDFKKNFNTK